MPEQLITLLGDAGYDVARVRHHLSPDSVDALVIQKAQQLERVLLSLNGDFSDIVAYPPKNFGGIISIQLHNHPEILPALTVTLIAFLQAHPDREFYRRKLCIIEVHRIRIRE